MTPSKIKNPKQIYTSLKTYIDKTAGFVEHGKRPNNMSREMIKQSKIELAIPNKTNTEQYKQIEKAIKYAKDNGVELKVTRIK